MLRRRSLMGGGPKDYIEFANADIGAYFAQRYGDGVGITYAQAAAITEFDSDLKIMDVVGNVGCTFEELNYFTGLISLPDYFCSGNNGDSTKRISISSLYLPNLVSISSGCFSYTNILELDFPKVSFMSTYAIMSSTTKRIILGDALTDGQNASMGWLDNLEYLYFSNLKTITHYNVLAQMTGATNLKMYIATPSGPPTIDASIGTKYYDGIFYVASTAKLYVPSNLVSAYKSAGAPWTTVFASINAI